MNENTTEKKYQDEELTTLLSDINNPEKNSHTTKQAAKNKSGSSQKIDVLDLPPRKEVHNNKSKRIKIRFTSPYIRVVVIVLLIMMIFASGFYIWAGELKEMIQHIDKPGGTDLFESRMSTSGFFLF